MDVEKRAGMTIGRAVVTALDGNRCWIETRSGGRLFFSVLHAWKSEPAPVIGDRVEYRQIGADFKAVKRVV